MKLARVLICVSAIMFANAFKAQIVINAAVEHVNPGGTDSTGNVNLTIYGGTAPYNFTWMKNVSNDAGTTQDLINVSKGYYTLNISDANNTTAVYSYNLGSKVLWTGFNGITESNDVLTVDGTVSNAPSAVSSNILQAHTDGWAEFVLQQAANSFFLGFSDNANPDVPGSVGDIEFGAYAIYGNLYAYVSGSYTHIAYLVTGDVIRVQRVGDLYYICQNDTYLYALPASSSKSLRVKAVINQPMSNVGCSFDGYDSHAPFRVNPVVGHIKPDGVATTGNIMLNPSGGTTPYTCAWTPSADGTTLKDAAPGHYRMYLSDANSQLIENVYSLGYKVLWADFAGLAARRDSLIVIESNPQVDNPISVSENVLKPNESGWAEMIVPEQYDNFLVGFVDWQENFDPNMGINDVQFGIYLVNGNVLYSYTDGWNMQYIANISAGDALEIERGADNRYVIRQNGTEIYSQYTDPNRKLVLKAYTSGSMPVKNLGCSFVPPFSASFVKKVASSDDPLNGGVTVYPYGAKGPFTVTWSDSTTGNSKPRLMPGRYIVTIADSAHTDSITKTVEIGAHPSWGRTNYITDLPDTLKHEDGRLGVAIAGNTSAPDEPSGFEMKMSQLSQDVFVGFAGATSNLQTDAEIAAGHLDDFWNTASYNTDKLITTVIDNKIQYDGKYNTNMVLDDNTMNFVRANNGVLTIIKNGISTSENTFGYDEGDVVKVGRDDDGKMFVSNNDRVLYQESADARSTTDQYLYPVLAINSTVVSPVISVAAGPITYPPMFVPLTMYAKPTRKLDGGFCTAVAGRVYFSVEGEYNLTQLSYKVYDKTNSVVMSNATTGVLNTTSQVLGDNRHYLNVSSLANGVYVLEVTNEKNEKRFLRFKQYPASTGGTGTSNQN